VDSPAIIAMPAEAGKAGEIYDDVVVNTTAVL